MWLPISVELTCGCSSSRSSHARRTRSRRNCHPRRHLQPAARRILHRRRTRPTVPAQLDHSHQGAPPRSVPVHPSRIPVRLCPTPFVQRSSHRHEMEIAHHSARSRPRLALLRRSGRCGPAVLRRRLSTRCGDVRRRDSRSRDRIKGISGSSEPQQSPSFSRASSSQSPSRRWRGR